VVDQSDLLNQQNIRMPALLKLPSKEVIGKFIKLVGIKYVEDSITSISHTITSKEDEVDTTRFYTYSLIDLVPIQSTTTAILTKMELMHTPDNTGEFEDRLRYYFLNIKLNDINFYSEYLAKTGKGQRTMISHLFNAGITAEYNLPDSYDKEIYKFRINSRSIDRLKDGIDQLFSFSLRKHIAKNSDLAWDALEKGIIQFFNDPALLGEINKRQNESTKSDEKRILQIAQPKIVAPQIKIFSSALLLYH